MNVYEVIRRPLITEKGHIKREADNTLCFEVHKDANKIEIKQAVETVFKVKVGEVRTSVFAGKLRRRGTFTGYASDWKKAYVRLAAGQKDARVRGNLSEEAARHANKKFSSHNANAALPNVSDARRHHQADAGEDADARASKRTGGRTSTGRISSRFIGGGHKQSYRIIDFKRDKEGVEAVVAAIEYDPNRSARIALLHYVDGEKRYIICAGGPRSRPQSDVGSEGGNLRRQCAAAEEHSGRYGGAQH